MTGSELKLTQESTPQGVLLIDCDGVLDAHTAGDLDRLIGGLIGQGNHRIACDLSRVTYIASAGVGVFIGFVNACKEQGGDLVLVHPLGFGGERGTGLTQGYNVLEVFNLLGLADFITVAKTRAEAVKLLAGHR